MTNTSERWWALIGPALFLEPSGFISTSHDSWRALDRTYDLGDLRLDPGERKLEDYVQLIAKGWSRRLSWPIIVSGDAAGVWPSVALSASRSVHRLCCLWSLAWVEAWQVRLAPQLVSYYTPEVPQPILVPSAEWRTNLDHDPENHRDPQPLPAWLPGAWDRLNDDVFRSRVDPALSLWHEGILLQAEHPSMAMVAYIAVVEQLAQSVLNPGGGRSSRQSFWRAVEAVATPEDAVALKRADAYGKRSATAHGGALHGVELEFGHMLLQPIGPGDPTYDFMFDSLQRMKLVSRAVLMNELG